MAKAGKANEVISLPPGGGAVSGIGETFSPDLFTGTGNFTVPIELPPGRNGFQPELKLIYSTGNGNGPFGLGWSLSIPGVSRKTSKGVPRYRDAADVFLLSGAEDLVPVSGDFPGEVQYRPRTEGLFARIAYHRDNQNSFWKVCSKDGLASVYGTPAALGADPAVVAAPDDRTQVFAWKLTRTLDAFGNRIEYEYERDSGEEGPHRWDQLYLKRIRYVEYNEAGTNAERFLISVGFEYEERPDPFSDYRSGFEIRTRKRCRRIVVRTHADKDRRVRIYQLSYLDERIAAGELPEALSPLNGASLLSQIRVIGHDDEQSEEADQTAALPPLEFSYTTFQPKERDFFPLESRNLPARSLASPNLELADLFGNGLPDIIEMNGAVRYWRNLGGGRFDLPREMREAPVGLRLADPGVQLIDANGDGRIDLLATANGLSGYFPLNFQGAWDRRSFQRYRQAPSFNLEDAEVQLVDLDGDGVTDAIRSGRRFESFFNDPLEGWNDTRRVERRDLEAFPDVNFSDPRVRWADMTGDGLQDIVLVHDGNIEYWPNLGHGDWGKRIHMRGGPRFPYGYDPRRILLGDVDGDGLADLVYVDHCKVVLYINQGGNRWSEPIEIDGTPPVTDLDAVRLMDMLGTGVSGVLWSEEAKGQGRPHMFFLDFTGGAKPYLLDEMDNHLGAVTRVAYAPSTRFYLEDEQSPETRWQTPLPFPVQVVARVAVVDEISRGKLTTEYRYHHGHWDGAEREFRGFGRVDQRDTEVFEDYQAAGLHPDRSFAAVASESFSPPTETRTWFHQGPIGEEFGDWYEADYSAEFFPDDPQRLERPADFAAFLRDADIPRRVKRDTIRALRGRILRTELYARDDSAREDRPFTVTEHLHSVREEQAPADPGDRSRQRMFFPHPVANRTTQWERGDDLMTKFRFTEDYDPFGQPQQETRIACPRGWRELEDTPGEPYLATQSRTVYAEPVDPEVYIVDRVAKVTTRETGNDGTQRVLELKDVPDDSAALTVIEQTLNFYDGEAFEGRSFGEVGEHGALVRSESLALTEDILHDGYKSGDAIADPPERPSYLVPGAAPVANVEHPQEFLDFLPELAGYTFHPGDADRERGYFVVTTRHKYDVQDSPEGTGQGMRIVTRDPLGDETGNRDTHIDYDFFDLLPTKVTDPAGLEILASYDARVLQPREVSDSNGNRTEYAFTPLGLLEEIFVRGKDATEGDDNRPSTRFEYDFLAFANSPPDQRQPVFVHTIQHEHHDTEMDVPLPERNATIETREYSDGFGRLLQTRTQAEDVLFGEPVFGGGVLPADQDETASTQAAVVGQERSPGDPPNVVVSGWQIYDNKGQVVEQFEPFVSRGYGYLSPDDERTRFGREVLGQKVTLFYDPRGQVIRTVNPDGSEQRVVQGVPGSIAQPDVARHNQNGEIVFEPTPWETYTYDPNDLASLSEPPDQTGLTLADRAPEDHHFTPASIEVDALGRTIKSVERNGPNPSADWFTTRSTYDIRGNLLTVTDALGRKAFQYTYDLADNPLRIESIDAGLRRLVLDAAGNEIERRDGKGALILQAYDRLQRPIRMWARDDAAGTVTLREHLVYGDAGDPAQAPVERATHRAENRLGALHEHYDEAGRLTFERYDFKGNVLEKVRQIIGDDAISSVVASAFQVDWQPPGGTTLDAHAATLLDSFEYRTSSAYDALDRIKRTLYPQDVEGQRQKLRPIYNRAGALQRVTLSTDSNAEPVTYVEHIGYDAKGQRTLIALGNGVMTRYAYDPETFRLARLRSERYEKPEPDTPIYEPTGAALQDFAYEYDLIGNILAITDRTLGCGVQDNPQSALVSDPALASLVAQGDALIRRFIYDPLYRLTAATGRECQDIPRPRPFADDQRCGANSGNHGTPNQENAPHLTAPYREEYAYDPAGNMLSLTHRHNGNAWTRHFGMGGMTPEQWNNEWPVHLATGEWPDPRGNHLTHVGHQAANIPQSHFFDANGNLTREHTARHFEWDHSDQLKAYRTQVEGSPPSVRAHYLYDAIGQRVKKLVRNQQGEIEATIYIDGFFEHHRWQGNGSGTGENNRFHVMDDQQRIAMLRVGDPHPKDEGPKVQYPLGDHLGSSNLVVDDQANFINREEYTPYGETSFGSFGRKRYRFSGKERDEESGLYYHGARYYVPWVGRWATADPAGLVDGTNLYRYARDNPIGLIDPEGMQAQPENERGRTRNLQPSIVSVSSEKKDELSKELDIQLGSSRGLEGAVEEGSKEARTQPLALMEQLEQSAQEISEIEYPKNVDLRLEKFLLELKLIGMRLEEIRRIVELREGGTYGEELGSPNENQTRNESARGEREAQKTGLTNERKLPPDLGLGPGSTGELTLRDDRPKPKRFRQGERLRGRLSKGKDYLDIASGFAELFGLTKLSLGEAFKKGPVEFTLVVVWQAKQGAKMTRDFLLSKGEEALIGFSEQAAKWIFGEATQSREGADEGRPCVPCMIRWRL
ncbi:SpvB/TcaC N-terminal domain-containing protein [Halomonas cerina]|uniref:RHS repeat-associated protein n=1 Tax=Halomonas cerina TaxID=447424 RepID=A0A839V598_9GAMM|nr:SpvB/TcaC N-terminal domain-containing protein [Halomonas cerina]MBB3188945.1 RHS repeat-associated protein [Halomonas cerina]